MAPTTSADRSVPAARTSPSLLWFVLLGGGLAWFGRFLVIWVIAEFGCVSGVLEVGGLQSPLVMLGLASLPFFAIGTWACLLGWKRLKHLPKSSQYGDEQLSSARFMLKTGVATSAVFVFIMLVEAVPIFFFLEGCRSFTFIFGA